MASAGFEPANLSSISQHATPRTPKSLKDKTRYLSKMGHIATDMFAPRWQDQLYIRGQSRFVIQETKTTSYSPTTQ